MATFPVPVELIKAEKRVFGTLTLKQVLVLFAAMPLAAALALIFPLPALERLIAGLAAYGVLAVPTFFKIHGVPLLSYLGGSLLFKLTPKRYVKVTEEKSAELPIQNWLGIRDVKEDVVVIFNNQYFTILKIAPIDLMLRPAAQRELVYSAVTTLNNTLDFRYQFVVVPSAYNPEKYAGAWEEKRMHYDANSEEAYYCRLQQEEFQNAVRDYDVPARSFYMVIPLNIKDLAPALLKEEKRAIKLEKNPKKKKQIRAEYEKKKFEAAAQELRIRKGSAVVALQSIDPDLKVEELKEDEIVEALKLALSGG